MRWRARHRTPGRALVRDGGVTGRHLARIRPGERLGPVRPAGLALAGASVALIAVAGAG
jgi:hypothetical protein